MATRAPKRRFVFRVRALVRDDDDGYRRCAPAFELHRGFERNFTHHIAVVQRRDDDRNARHAVVISAAVLA